MPTTLLEFCSARIMAVFFLTLLTFPMYRNTPSAHTKICYVPSFQSSSFSLTSCWHILRKTLKLLGELRCQHDNVYISHIYLTPRCLIPENRNIHSRRLLRTIIFFRLWWLSNISYKFRVIENNKLRFET